MQQLNFSLYRFNNKKVSILMKSGKIYHSYPEEWVRQHVVDFIEEKNQNLINVEKV
jgi:hypothetical protein